MHLGFDIGGTKVLGVALEGDSPSPVATGKRPTVPDADTLFESILAVAGELIDEVGVEAESLGVGIAGIVDRKGTLWYSPNIPGVVDFHLRTRLQDATTARIHVENDASCATWAEMTMGAGRGSDNVGLVALGTGIGTGFVLDGRLHRGWNGFSGESGHMIVEMSGGEHLTGARGPWEMYASGTGIRATLRREVEEGKLPSILEAAGTVDRVTGEHLAIALEAGDPDAVRVIDDFSRVVGIGVANLVHILDLEVIVISGGMVDLGAPLIDGIQRWTNEYVLGGEHRPRPRVVPAELGSAAAAIGAAILARDFDD